MSHVCIGISGWTYAPWRGVFYPKGVTQKRELEFASRQLNSIEINGSFYSLQRPSSYQAWFDATPDDFVFSVKGGRYITHLKRLRDIRMPLANFFASGILKLGKKLGPILWQFPPNFAFDAETFEAFFKMLPRDTAAAAKFAGEHDAVLKGRAWTQTDAKRPIRYAVEFRHPSFETPRFVDLLRKYNIAVCIADTAGLFPYAEDVTGDFVYIRLHGAEQLYASGYTDSELDRWAKRITTWMSGKEPRDAVRVGKKSAAASKGRDVFVYFDNDVKVHAPFDAAELSRRVGCLPKTSVITERHPPAKALKGVPRQSWPGFRRAAKK